MLELDRAAIEKILCRIEEAEFLFSGYRFCRSEGGLCLLGKGGYSSVYEVYDETNPDRHYALKVGGFERHTVSREEFYRMIYLQRSFCEHSPNVLRILTAKELPIEVNEEGELEGLLEQDGIWLQLVLMEKLQGLLTKDKFRHVELTRKALADEEEVLCFAKQIGQVLLMMHQNNVLHRDIKLENIFWDEEAQLYKLGDFGIAKYTESGSAETVVYTDGYGAPEIGYRPGENYNETADIYSFGIVLFLLLNDLCFPGSDGYYVNMVQYSPEFLFPAAKNASPQLNRIIQKMCSYDREDRYQSMTEVLAELNRLGADREGQEDDISLELSDLATETYREPKKEPKSGYREGSLWEQRVQRKMQQRAWEEYYSSQSVWYMVGLAVLFVLLLQSLQEKDLVTGGWQLWILPLAALLEAVFLRLKEFHITFGIGFVLLLLYSGAAVGFTVVHAILLGCTVLGIPGVMAAGAIGTGFWLFLAERLVWLDFLSDWDVGWLVLVAILVLINRYVILRYAVGKEKSKKALRLMELFDSLVLILGGAGLALLLLEHFEILEVSSIVEKLHLIRVGIACLVAEIIEFWDILTEEEEEEDVEDVSVDE